MKILIADDSVLDSVINGDADNLDLGVTDPVEDSVEKLVEALVDVLTDAPDADTPVEPASNGNAGEAGVSAERPADGRADESAGTSADEHGGDGDGHVDR
jgi:hypothetical protein